MIDYHLVWEALSRNWEDATTHVCGVQDEEEIRLNGKATAEFLRKALRLLPDSRVLEIGCGIGRVGRELAGDCGQWVGVDIASPMIDIARKRMEGIRNAVLEVLPASDLSVFSIGSFDAVYSTIVFMHLDTWDIFRYFREAHRVLKKGGRGYFDSLNLLSKEGWETFHSIVERYSPAERPAHSSRCATPQEMEKYARQAGFSEIQIEATDPALVTALVVK